MVRIEGSKGRKGEKDSEDSSPKRESKRTFEDYRKERGTSGRAPSRGRASPRGRDSGRAPFRDRRDSGRGPNRFSRNTRDVEMTKVICSSCGVECEVPFKPTSSKPVFCSDCFKKKEKSGSGKTSDRDLDVINEKLNKIMKALKIE